MAVTKRMNKNPHKRSKVWGSIVVVREKTTTKKKTKKKRIRRIKKKKKKKKERIPPSQSLNPINLVIWCFLIKSDKSICTQSRILLRSFS